MAARLIRSRLAIFALLGLFATTTSGCGWLFTHGPPDGYQQMNSFSCTQSIAPPVLDLIGFTWFTINGSVNAGNGDVVATAIDGVLTVALAWSGLDGARKIGRCRAAQAQLASRQAAPPGLRPAFSPPAGAPPFVAGAGPASAAVRAVTLSVAADTLRTGETVQLFATARDGNGGVIAGVAFAWTTSDTTVAVVSGKGLVTARGAGAAVVAAKADTVVGKAKIVVTRR